MSVSIRPAKPAAAWHDHPTPCQGCSKHDAVTVLEGNVNCYYCGHQIYLCSACLKQLVTDLTRGTYRGRERRAQTSYYHQDRAKELP